jgi:catechol-2,3-dioxygenase
VTQFFNESSVDLLVKGASQSYSFINCPNPTKDHEILESRGKHHGIPKRIGHLVLNVRDLEASTKFYTETLGFEVARSYNEK